MIDHESKTVVGLIESMNLWVQCSVCNHEELDFGGMDMPADFEFGEKLERDGWTIEHSMPVCPKCKDK